MCLWQAAFILIFLKTSVSVPVLFFFLIFVHLFIYLAALGLCCSTRIFIAACGIFAVVCRLLSSCGTQVFSSLVVAQAPEYMGSVAAVRGVSS